MARDGERYIIKAASFLLILLWVYAAASKLLDFNHFQQEMHKQLLPRCVQTALIWSLPPAELVTAVLFVFPSAVAAGLRASMILLVSFTGYISFTLLHVSGRIPCSCGGILTHLPWGVHLAFNCFFFVISITAIILERRERRLSGSDQRK